MKAELLRGMQVEVTPVRLPSSSLRVPPVVQAPVPAVVADVEKQVAAALDRLGEDARRLGFEDGLRRGEAEGQQRVASAVEAAVQAALVPIARQKEHMHELAQRLECALPQALAKAEDEMVALCFETLCRMVGEHLARAEGVRACLRHLASTRGDVLAVHVHPQDAALLVQAQDATHPRWVPDPQVEFGGCILQGPAGGLDLRLDAALEACKRALLDARAQRHAASAASRTGDVQ